MRRVQMTPNQAFEAWRLWIIYGLIAAIFGFYTFRLLSLQIFEGPTYTAQAEENRTSQMNLPTQRGIIYDRNGYVLARNIASYNVVITPASLPGDTGYPSLDEDSPDFGTILDTSSAVQEIYRQLGEMLDLPVSAGLVTDDTVLGFTPCQTEFGITQVVVIGDTNQPYSPIRIKCNVDRDTALTIQERASDWPGVGIEVEPIRDYPTGAITAEVIGFLGPIPPDQAEYYSEQGFQTNRDRIGYAGVEASLNDILMGTNGLRLVERDVAGLVIRDLIPPVPAIPGNNIRLTIDTRLQQVARETLSTWMKEAATNPRYNPTPDPFKYTSGTVVAMNPKTGEVLAMVSYPSYENNRMARFIPEYYYNQLIEDPSKPLLNKAISAEYPPGSVFKIATALGIANEGVVPITKYLEDPGRIFLEQELAPNDPNPVREFEYVCWTYKQTNSGHGDVDFLRAISESCDVYFYKAGGGYKEEVPGYGLGIWRIGEYARALGYGQSTGIELPGEAAGLVPDPDWKRRTQNETWATGDTYAAAMGQSWLTVTPLQMLVSAATVANDGKMMKPTLIREILDSEGNVIKPFEPEMIWDITREPLIREYDENFRTTGEMKVVEPWVVDKVKEGLRMVVTEGTAVTIFEGVDYQSAGKTGTAEYCDPVAWDKGICTRGSWPAHAWYVGYAPYDDPEIAVVAFVYNGDEGAILSAPVVREVMKAYFQFKANDGAPGGLDQMP